MKKTMFLVYRPVIQYEESIEPHVICDSREEADQVKRSVYEFMQRLAKRLPKYPGDDVPDEDFALYTAVDQRRREILAKAKWPYGIDMHSDLPSGSSFFDSVGDCLSVMELPVVKPKRAKAKEGK